MFSRPFSSSLHSILENVLSISSRTLWNVRMLVSISSLVDQFWNIVIQCRALSPIFVNCNSNSSITVAEHETAKTISSISAFIFVKVSIKFVSQVYRPNNTWQIWMTEYWICSKEWRIDPTFLAKRHRRISVTIDDFECWIFKVDWQNTNVNLTKLNFRFERSKLLRTKLNWKFMKLNAEVTKWAGKTYYYNSEHG